MCEFVEDHEEGVVHFPVFTVCKEAGFLTEGNGPEHGDTEYGKEDSGNDNGVLAFGPEGGVVSVEERDEQYGP